MTKIYLTWIAINQTGSDKQACKSRFANASSWMHLSLENSVLGNQGSPMKNVVSIYRGPEFSPRASCLCSCCSLWRTLICNYSAKALPKCFLKRAFQEGGPHRRIPWRARLLFRGNLYRCNIRRISSVRQFSNLKWRGSHIKLVLLFSGNFLLIKIICKL